MAPDHLRAAVEQLVNPAVTAASMPITADVDGSEGAVTLARDFTVRQDEASRVL